MVKRALQSLIRTLIDRSKPGPKIGLCRYNRVNCPNSRQKGLGIRYHSETSSTPSSDIATSERAIARYWNSVVDVDPGMHYHYLVVGETSDMDDTTIYLLINIHPLNSQYIRNYRAANTRYARSN